MNAVVEPPEPPWGIVLVASVLQFYALPAQLRRMAAFVRLSQGGVGGEEEARLSGDKDVTSRDRYV